MSLCTFTSPVNNLQDHIHVRIRKIRWEAFPPFMVRCSQRGWEIFCELSLSYRFRHPSTLLQGALAAIIPFHVPGIALRVALADPYSFRRTTYGESYHENSRGVVSWTAQVLSVLRSMMRSTPVAGAISATFMTGEYALGTASLPYVNAGHSDSVMVRMRSGRTFRNDRFPFDLHKRCVQ